ncbi:MAG: phytoene desaturase family protein [Steroidobacteraceae bacterium]|jgi:phytoene dehydrogenase-like protein
MTKAGENPGAGYDVVVIGGGHNGLVCANYLARGGRSVLLLEANARLGGAAVTREFAPGYQVSAGAHLLHLMPSEMIGALKLESHGLAWAGTHLPTTALIDGSEPLAIAAQLAGGATAADGAAYALYTARMRRYAAALAPMFASVPPRLGTIAWSDRLALLRLGWQIRRLGRTDMRELLRIGGMNVYDLLEENFQSPQLKGALAFDAVLGTNFGPRSPGTVLTLLYRLAAESAAGAAALAQPRGGLGGLCEALAKAAIAAGATLRTSSPVARILVVADRASGVVLESGEQIRARTVISSADPKTTLLKLLGARHLDTGFVRRVSHIRTRGLAAKLHLALSRAPQFTGLSAQQLAGRLLIAPSMQYIEHAYNHAKYGEFSEQPVMEITVPTIGDSSLAPAGHHVLSAIVQYAPYAVKAGWDAARPQFTERAIAMLERYAPGIRESIVGAELLTPADMEREFRIDGGHWHHGELAFDQFLMVRPVPGAAQHRAPLAGLYLCGAGCHPGGGVMGIAGRNAAQQVLKQVT